MRPIFKAATLCTALVFSLTACKKTADSKPNFESAINNYYQSHPSCVWGTPQKFPVQMGHDDPRTTQFDALTDQGLLTRTSAEKKIIIISKRENNYDLNDKGRSAWTPDPSQPGFGNFCYGHPKVQSITSSTPTTDQPGATTTVQFVYTFADVPSWATNPEVQTAFPRVQSAVVGPHNASTTLTNTSDGWQITSTNHPSTSDSNIVE